MRKTLSVALLGAMTVAGCAKDSEDVVAQYQSPVRYTSMSCQDISMELERVKAAVGEVSAEQDDAAQRDRVAMGVGLVLFWPALFVLAGGDEKEQLAQLKGEYEALDAAYLQKDCANAPTRIAAAQPQVTYAQLPAGTPTPYEGVRLSSYSSSDMKWFCEQNWRFRPSPDGRTEYNPCHMPEAFSR